jgi:alkyl hydroperoxide reductase subunit F
MLDTTLKTQLKAYLEKLTRPIQLLASLDDSEKAKEMQALLREIAELSDKISLSENTDDHERKPSFAITSPGHDINLRFAGIPMGHEFTSLVLALLQAGGHPPKVDADVIEQIKNLDGDFHLRPIFL